MRARVLGSAAAGGFPRWNCSCPSCGAIRRGDRRFLARTGDSLAVFARDDAAVICNAAPELAQQIEQTPALHPRGAHTPIAAIVLTDGELDHVLGLLSLREAQPLAIYATAAVQRALVERDAIAALLDRCGSHPAWRTLELGREHELTDARGEPTGVRVEPFAVRTADDTVGLVLRVRERSIVYAPRAVALPPGLGDDADVMVLDGTSWPAIGGPDGSLAQLSGCRARRKIFTHVDHENPMLALGSPERREVERAGWVVAHDGMEILA